MSSEAHEQLVELKARLGDEKHVDDVFLEGHRAYVRAAVKATNGCEDKQQAIIDLLGVQAVLTVEEKLREPDRMKAYFDKFHACKLDSMMVPDGKGGETPPWSVPATPSVDTSEITAPLGIRFKGPVVKMIAKYTILGAVMLFAVYIIVNRNDKVAQAQLNDGLRAVVPVIVQSAVDTIKASQGAQP